jgi:cysteine desulfurase/selenocysteine lyase
MDKSMVREDTLTFANGIIYMDHAGGSVPPRQVVQAIKNYLDELANLGSVNPSFYERSMDVVTKAKRKLASFINAESEAEIALTKTGSEAIGIVANGIRWQKGDQVIVNSLEVTSGFVPWLRLEKEGKIEMKIVGIDKKGILKVEEVEHLITPKTRLILISQVSNAIGTIQPVEEIGKLAKENDALFMVNASQAAGQTEIDVKKLKCDFLVAPCRKWLRGPQGLGFLYCKKELISELEPSHIGWTTTKWISEKTYEHLQTCERFEAGEANFPAAVGLARSLDYIQEVGGINAIRAEIKKLTCYLLEQLSGVKGVEIYGVCDEELRGGIVPFNIKNLEPSLISEKMAEQKIIIEAGTFAAPLALGVFNQKKWARVCVHYFNTTEDIDKFIQVVKNLAK